MLPAAVPHPKDDKTARAHLPTNVHAAGGDLHPGHWELHSWFKLPAAPGDFTPVTAPDYAEIHDRPLAQVLEFLGDVGPTCNGSSLNTDWRQNGDLLARARH
jgi:hypothetical protein